MSLRNDFDREAKRNNWHLSWFKTSSLVHIQNALKNFNKRGPYYFPNSPQNLQVLATAINNFKRENAAKFTKYKIAIDWLESKIPPLKPLLASKAIPVGQTALGYQAGKPVRLKDSDGKWHSFELQKRGNSCGPACVRNVLRAYTHILGVNEEDIQNEMGLVEDGHAHTGMVTSNHNWDNIGSNVPSIVKVLFSKGIRNARAVTGDQSLVLSELKKCSKNNPGIIGWWWGPSYGQHDAHHSGHWTVCVGPDKSGSKLIILDPWNEIQYIPIASFNEYQVKNGGYGWFNPTNKFDPAVILTHPKT